MYHSLPERLGFFTLFFCILLFFVFKAFAEVDGIYSIPTDSGVKLKLSDGHYRIWMEESGETFVVQEGEYTLKGKHIYFMPHLNNISDLADSKGEIIDNCRLKWEGDIFLKENCLEAKEHSKHQACGRSAHFPQKWRVYRTKSFEIYLPLEAKIKTNEKGIKIKFRDGSAGLEAVQAVNEVEKRLLKRCKPVAKLAKGNTKFFVCKNDTKNRYLEIVTKGEPPKILSYVSADDLATIKALSLAISTIKFLGKDSSLVRQKIIFRKWQPKDRSFSIQVPVDWQVQGGTADFGRNGYIRIVQAGTKDNKIGFLGLYYPFYQYAQIGYTGSGIVPMDSEKYLKSLFFSDLARNYQITFDNLNITNIEIDQRLSQELTSKVQNMISQKGMNIAKRYEVFVADAIYDFDETPYQMKIFGAISYTTMPLEGAYSYVWGPEPVFLAVAPSGKMDEWLPVFQKISQSWLVNPQWLVAHQHYAAEDTQRALKHFKKISSIIRKHEESMSHSTYEWEQQQNLEMELHWDTFYALGGEERYDNPITGEEVDVPTGADKYLYDQYSQSWIGINFDKPEAEEVIQHLKEKGFVELVPHRY